MKCSVQDLGFRYFSLERLARFTICATASTILPVQTAKMPEPSTGVHYVDMREQGEDYFSAGSTQTEKKVYLETIGTGVAWIDYDQDEVMDLYCQSASQTDIYRATSTSSALCHDNGDGTFTDVTAKAESTAKYTAASIPSAISIMTAIRTCM